MNDDLQQLLDAADAGAPSARRALLSGGDVRRMLTRKRRVRAAVRGCGVAVVVASIGTAALFHKPATNVEAIAPATMPGLQPKFESKQLSPSKQATDAMIAVHEQTVALLLKAERSQKTSKASALMGYDATEQRDRAALILIYDAKRFTADNRPSEALAAYRRTVELFPESSWAEFARDQLRQQPPPS